MSFIVFGLLATLISTILCDDSSQCSPWVNIEKKLKAQHLQVNCTQNITCTGISCLLQEYGQEIHSSINVNSCENPPSLEFFIDAPKLNINSWKRKFYHGDIFSVTDTFGGEFSMQKVNDTFILGLTLQYHADKNRMPSLMRFLPSVRPEIRYPLFQNIGVPIPQCSDPKSRVETRVVTNMSVTTSSSAKIPMLVLKDNAPDSKNCTITLKSCPENELCQQFNTSTLAGVCVCIPDYIRDKNGKCIFHPTVAPATVVPGGHTDPHHSETSNTSLLLTAILVPITVIVLIVGMVYATIRFRICQKMRRRLRVQVYEHVLLGQDDDDEIEDEALNPVV